MIAPLFLAATFLMGGVTFPKITPGVSTAEDVVTALGSPDREAKGATIGSTKGLRVMVYDGREVTIALQKDRVVLISRLPAEDERIASEMRLRFGESSAVLASAAAPEATLEIFDAQGVALHILDGELLAIESFTPGEPYRERFYVQPAADRW